MARQRWTKERVLDEIQRLYKTTGRINTHHVQNVRKDLNMAAHRHCGGWKKAVIAAGLDYERIRIGRRWTKESILNGIKDRLGRGLAVNSQAVAKSDSALLQAGQDHFKDGWREALSILGINADDLDPRRIWTKKRIIREIRRIVLSGEPANLYHLIQTGRAGFIRCSAKQFGSYKKAVRAAGFNYAKIQARRMNYWTKKRIVREIRRLEKIGQRLDRTTMGSNNEFVNLMNAAQRLFGSWSKAVYAAEIDYMQHSRVWSAKAWLNKLSSDDVQRIRAKSAELVMRKTKLIHERRKE